MAARLTLPSGVEPHATSSGAIGAGVNDQVLYGLDFTWNGKGQTSQEKEGRVPTLP